jgi:hypothetical protein
MAEISDYDPLFLPGQRVYAEDRPGKCVGFFCKIPGPYFYLVEMTEDASQKWFPEDDVRVLFLH